MSSMRSREVFPVFPVIIKSGTKILETFNLCHSGASLQIVIEKLMNALTLM